MKRHRINNLGNMLMVMNGIKAPCGVAFRWNDFFICVTNKKRSRGLFYRVELVKLQL